MFEKINQGADKMYGKKVLFFVPLVLIIVLILTGIIMYVMSLNSGSGGGVYSNAMPSYAPSMGKSSSYSSESFASPMVSDSTSGSAIPSIDRKIIKDASLDLTVSKVEDTADLIQGVAVKYGGLVDSSDISNGGADTKYGTLTIRVPNEKFDLAIGEIKAFAVKVESEKISSEDVTAQAVDLEARLKSKRAVEAQYVALLQKATKVDEIVSVSSYLNNVREDIERLQAQSNYLSQQVAMSTITVSMTSEAEVQIFGITWHPITVIKQSFRNFLGDMAGTADWLIAFVFMLPGFLIRLVIFLVILWIVIKICIKIYRKIRKNHIPPQQKVG